MPLISKHAFGSKENIETAKTEGTINERDILFLDNREIGWIDKNGNTIMSTSRTQEAVTVNGVTGLGIANNATIPAGTSFDELVKMLVQKPIPATYSKPTLALANNGGQASGNVEAGTSNFTDVMGYTTTTRQADGVTVDKTKLDIAAQEISQIVEDIKTDEVKILLNKCIKDCSR